MAMAGGRLTTHVLDTARGKPAAGVRIVLIAVGPDGRRQLAETVTNADGRTDGPMLAGDALRPGQL
jgi:5-hydroxyisourate hydrolase